MLAVFQHRLYQPWHHAQGVPAALVLEGESPEALAWDLVEQFFDDLELQDALRTREAAAMVGNKVPVGAQRPSLSRTQRYHEARFTEAWWAQQAWTIADFLGHYQLGETGLAHFRERYTPPALLALYLSTMMGRYFVRTHGQPLEAIEPASALGYFEAHGYLQWLDARDPHAVTRIVQDDPRSDALGPVFARAGVC